ncbi:MAG TPA: cobalt transporter [Ignisphaera sp.]|uniref:Cobalt transporter n=1 Tax=Ignisphaera aggregans TaxID=334771 RepID=A0A833DUB5_9CREN|nr:cobalt transporter [Ignisphaera sp.]HIP56754.1 cobalt transporter [Ignisphaera aggregans]
MVRKIAVRKVLRIARELRFVSVVVIASFILAALGFALYLVYVPSLVVLMEGFVWLIEGISFFSLMVVLKIATSRAVFYGSRYEIFRSESFAAILVSIVATVIVCLNIAHSIGMLINGTYRPSLIGASTYLLGSAILSYIMSSKCRAVLESRKVFILTAKTMESKLRLDALFELGAGVAIIVSNVFNTPIIENGIAIAMGVYVLWGVATIARDSFLNLIGIGPKEHIERTRRNVIAVIKSITRFRIRKLLIETFGSFAEIELWLEAPPNLTLRQAYRYAVSIAREVVLRVPEAIRALVVIVPQTSSVGTTHRGYYRRLSKRARRIDSDVKTRQTQHRNSDSVKS